jgi:O-antigen ligase
MTDKLIAKNRNILRAFIWIVIICISVAGACASWGTYNQFYIGLTYVTLPVIIAFFIGIFCFTIGYRVYAISIADTSVVSIYIISYFSQMWALRVDGWSNQFYWYTICFMLYFSSRFFVNEIKYIRYVIAAVAFGAIIGGSLVTQQIDDWGEILERQTVGGHNANFTAYVLVGSVFLINIGCFVKLFNKRSFLWVVPVNFFVFSKLVLLGTRGAIISFFSILLWLFIYKFIPRKTIKYLIILYFILIAMFPFGVFDFALESFEGLFSRNTGDLSGRLPAWITAKEQISNHLLLGIGVGSFALVNPLGIGAHNVFLTMMLEVGLIGFCFMLLMLWSIFLPALKKNATPDQIFIFGAFFMFWLPIAATGHWELSPFSWLLLALTFNLMRLNRESYA